MQYLRSKISSEKWNYFAFNQFKRLRLFFAFWKSVRNETILLLISLNVIFRILKINT